MQTNEIQSWIESSSHSDDWQKLKDPLLHDLSVLFDEHALYLFGRHLWYTGRSNLAVQIFDFLFKRGLRDENFISDYAGLLTGEMAYDKLEEVCNKTINTVSPALNKYLNLLLGQSFLAKLYKWDMVLELSREREQKSTWRTVDQVYAQIRDSISKNIPYSLIRLGDGEAKALVYYDNMKTEIIPKYQSIAIGNNIWQNWFGTDITTVNEFNLSLLFADYKKAIFSASVLATVTEQRFRSDTSHFGYMAHQEFFLKEVPATQDFTDSMVHYQLNEMDRFLARLLNGQIVSFISPYDQLAPRFSLTVGCKIGRSFVIPGERRLPTEVLDNCASAHYPQVYHTLLKELRMCRPGEVFLVAAGFLGKIYCGVIKEAGGIAIDVGSIVDGWMGYNTRPGHLDNAKTLSASAQDSSF